MFEMRKRIGTNQERSIDGFIVGKAERRWRELGDGNALWKERREWWQLGEVFALYHDDMPALKDAFNHRIMCKNPMGQELQTTLDEMWIRDVFVALLKAAVAGGRLSVADLAAMADKRIATVDKLAPLEAKSPLPDGDFATLSAVATDVQVICRVSEEVGIPVEPTMRAHFVELKGRAEKGANARWDRVHRETMETYKLIDKSRRGHGAVK
jgi:hypothetical protein